jgi:hypothetical protein
MISQDGPPGASEAKALTASASRPSPEDFIFLVVAEAAATHLRVSVGDTRVGAATGPAAVSTIARAVSGPIAKPNDIRVQSGPEAHLM